MEVTEFTDEVWLRWFSFPWYWNRQVNFGTGLICSATMQAHTLTVHFPFWDVGEVVRSGVGWKFCWVYEREEWSMFVIKEMINVVDRKADRGVSISSIVVS